MSYNSHMSLASKHIFNRLFTEVQEKMNKNEPNKVLDILERASQLALAKTISPIEYYYLTDGVDPNEWLNEKDGYKRYKKDSERPAFWLHKFRDQASGRTLGQIALAMEDVVREKIKKEIDQKYEGIKHQQEQEEQDLLKEKRSQGLTLEGTPFGRDWVIKPPRRER
jgi:hypothetical protein